MLLFGISPLHADEFEMNYGNGVVHIQADSISTLSMYDGPNGKEIHTLSLTHNAWSLGRTMITFDRLIDSVPAWFATEYFIVRGEYARIDIRTVDSTEGFYRTTLRDSANRPIWIKKHKHVFFLSWLRFYQSVASVELNDGDLILYDKPDPKSKRVNYTSLYNPEDLRSLRPIEIKGHWMKVEIQIPERDPLLSWKTYTGWIKWRDDKQPLISYNLMGC